MNNKPDKKLPWPDAPGLWWATKDGEREQVWAIILPLAGTTIVCDEQTSWWSDHPHGMHHG